MRHLLVPLIATVALVASCGGDDSSKSSDDAPPAEKRAEPTTDEPAPAGSSKFTGRAKEQYDTAKVVCAIKPVRGIARDFNLRTSDPVKVAERYARGYRPEFRQAAFEGCFEGLRK